MWTDEPTDRQSEWMLMVLFMGWIWIAFALNPIMYVAILNKTKFYTQKHMKTIIIKKFCNSIEDLVKVAILSEI